MIQIITTGLLAFAFNNISLLPSEVYTPHGFDTNDKNVQIAFDGFYPDSCYQYLPTVAKVSESERKIYVDNKSAYSNEMLCAKVIRYFDDIINLGPIETTGEYTIAFKSRSGEYVDKARIIIAEPQNQGSVDDILYAPVQELNIVREENTTLARLFIKSHNTCMHVKSVKKELQKNVMVVLPEIAYKEDDCGVVREPHTIVHDISLDGLSGKILLHIRAMNGKAISRFVEL